MADQLIRAVAADGGIRVVGAITTRLVEEARNRHRLSYVATAALGRTLTAGALLVSNMKREDARINIQIQGDGPLGGILVDARLDGSVRGYVSDPSIELPPNAQGKLDVGAAVGKNGYLYIVRDAGLGYPYSSTVELVSGEIGDDLTQYLATSEQTPSALVLGVFVDQNGVEAAGGYCSRFCLRPPLMTVWSPPWNPGFHRWQDLRRCCGPIKHCLKLLKTSSVIWG